MIEKQEEKKPVASHWRNSNFQIAYFLAGKAHTPDEAHRILCQLYEERDVALKNAEASSLRQQAKKLRAEKVLLDSNIPESEKLEAQADLLEMEAFKDQSEACILEAREERDFIKKLIDRIEPYRQYAHLPYHQAHQAAQLEEWKQELMWRAENYLLTHGTIPADHFETMRLHPAFETEIFPKVKQIMQANSEGKLLVTSKKMPTSVLAYLQEDKTE